MSAGVGVMWSMIFGGIALAGYGDARDGLPTHSERETFFWTNAYRVQPDAFQSEVPCDFGSFSATERTAKAPFRYNADLTDAAFYHSDDMRSDGYFSHDSNDGTSWSTRIHRYYSGFTIGENIAYGYGSPFEAVIRGWMCSSGHRANIMSSSYNELGTGVSGTYYTQDFGAGQIPARAMSMGVHLPRNPAAEVTFYVDYDHAVDPDAIYVVVDGVRSDLDLVIGTATRGVYGVSLTTGQGCQPYYFVAEAGGLEERFPEDGSYGFGDCAFDDVAAEWLADQIPVPDEVETTPTDTGTPTDTERPRDRDPEPDDTAVDDTGAEAAVPADVALDGCGCAGGGRGGAVAALLALALVRRRRAAC